MHSAYHRQAASSPPPRESQIFCVRAQGAAHPLPVVGHPFLPAAAPVRSPPSPPLVVSVHHFRPEHPAAKTRAASRVFVSPSLSRFPSYFRLAKTPHFRLSPPLTARSSHNSQSLPPFSVVPRCWFSPPPPASSSRPKSSRCPSLPLAVSPHSYTFCCASPLIILSGIRPIVRKICMSLYKAKSGGNTSV